MKNPLHLDGSSASRACSFPLTSAPVALLIALLAIASPASAQGTDCLITGPSVAECGIVQFYIATVPQNQNPFSVVWSLLNNTAGATFVGPNSCTSVNSCPVNINVTTTGSVTVHATITVISGTVVECEVLLVVIDTTNPSIQCPGDTTVECGGSIDPSATGTAIGTDTCGPATVTYVDQTVGVNCAGPVIERTWTATDPVGNIATCTQTITSTTRRRRRSPARTVSVQCFSLVPAPNIGSVTASRQLRRRRGGDPRRRLASNGTSSCNNVITRTYRATDPCGNQATCTQLITVNDTTPPVDHVPAAGEVQCFSQVPAAEHRRP